MKHNQLGFAAAAISALAGLAITGTAHADADYPMSYLTVTPTTVVAGGVVHWNIVNCLETGPATSSGFVKQPFADQDSATVIDRPGVYRIVARCDNPHEAPGSVAANFTIVCPPGTTATTAPPTTTTTTAPPTTTTTTTTAPPTTTSTTITEPSTTTPPGTTAALSAATFGNDEICAPNTPVTTPITPKKPEVAVTPKGAPQTGGGGMATVVGTWHVGQD